MAIWWLYSPPSTKQFFPVSTSSNKICWRPTFFVLLNRDAFLWCNENTVGKSLLTCYYWGESEQQMRQELCLKSLSCSFRPIHYSPYYRHSKVYSIVNSQWRLQRHLLITIIIIIISLPLELCSTRNLQYRFLFHP